MNMVILLFVSFFGMCLVGVPIAFSLLLAAFFTAYMIGMDPIVMIQQMYIMLDSYTLLAVPLFLMVGYVMEVGDITKRLVEFARCLVGHIRGGFGHVNIVAEMVLSGISGSATADAAALGSIMIPAMVKEGYPPAVAAAVNAAASTNGPIIPPSIMMIVYGAYANLSIAILFIGGMVPGIILGIALMIYVYLWAKKHNLPKSERRATLKECWTAFKKAFLALFATIIIFAGILSGIFTATEAGMIVTLYCLFITTFVYKLMNRKQMKYILQGTLESMTAPLLCVSAAGAFGYIMAYLKVPSYVLQLAGPIANSHYGVLLFFTILFLILGTFMDATPAIIIFMSVVQTLSASAGLNPYHVGVLICCVLCFGFITPPYGLTLLLSSGIAKVSPSEVIYESRWTFLLMLIVTLILIFFPDIILFLPRLFMPQALGL